LAKVIEDLDFDESLMMESLFVPNNLYCNRPSCSVISAAQHLAERTLPEAVHDLITITEMVTIDDEIVTTVIIIAVVVCRFLRMGRFLLATSTNIIYRRIIKNLSSFILREMLSLAALQSSFKKCE
jgi:hypothetical protein